ncbi:uncharacterized protein LOC132043840 [Lycium ferocissimum]|uniref:uncharacterized protein LOC132043840 n=1 Tax=Lycium ferocissimum TaxID=112874 RepID=UPI00281529A5|nr:uncharacterized protein LOC132043840 [Lycium ferocissimum]
MHRVAEAILIRVEVALSLAEEVVAEVLRPRVAVLIAMHFQEDHRQRLWMRSLQAFRSGGSRVPILSYDFDGIRRLDTIVRDWVGLTSILRDSSLSRLASYYQRFVEGFSSIASPLTRLTQKNVPFQWSDECEASFQKLKTLLTTNPILTLPVEGDGFTVYCDTLLIGLGGVLIREGDSLCLGVEAARQLRTTGDDLKLAAVVLLH